jgi:hypothetical protein
VPWILLVLCVLSIGEGIVLLLWGYQVPGKPEGAVEEDQAKVSQERRRYRVSGYIEIGLSLMGLIIFTLIIVFGES